MAITVAEIVAKIRAEGADQVVGEMKKGEAATSSFAQTASKIGQSMVGVGQKMTLGLTLPIAGMAVGFVNAASDLNEATTAASTTYGSAAKDIIGYSLDAATAVGLSREQYLSAATQIGVFGQAAGLTGKDLSSFGNDTIGAAADLASFYNAPVPEALDAIRAGLTGETEPLRRFGIMMSDAAVQQYALENGIWDGTGAMTEQQKVLARQGFIMDNMGAATGDFANTSEGLANQQRILRAELANLSAEMGQALLPIALKVVGGLRTFVDVLSKLSPHAKSVVLVVGAIVAAIGPLLVVFGTLLSAVGSVTAAFGTGGLLAGLTPLLAPIAAIIAAIALLAIAYKTNFLGFADAVNYVAGKVADGFDAIVDKVKYGVALFQAFRQYSNPVTAALQALAYVVGSMDFGPLNFLRDIAVSVFRSAAVAVDKFVERISRSVRQIRSGVKMITNAFKAGGIRGAIDEIFGRGGQFIAAGIGRMIGAVPRLIGDFLRSVSTGFKPLDAVLHSVGAMFQDVGHFITNVAKGEWGKALDDLKDLLGHFGDYLTSVPKLWLAAIQAVPWGSMWDALKTAVSGLAGIIGDAAKALANWTLDVGLPSLGGAILTLASGAWDWIKGQLPGLANLAGSIGSWAIDVAAPAVGGAILTAATSMWEWAKSGVSWLADNIDFAGIGAWAIDTAAPTVGGAILTAFSSMWEWVKSGATWLSDTLSKALDAWNIDVPVPGVLGAIVGAFTGLWDWVKSKVSWLGGGKVDSATVDSFDVSVPTPGVAGTIVGAFASIWDWVKDKVSWLTSFGDCLVPDFDLTVNLPGIIGGIVGAYTSVCDWVKDKVAWITNIGSFDPPSLSIDIPTPAIGGTIVGAFTSMWDAAKSVAPWLVTAVSKSVALTLSIGHTVGGAIVGAFPSMWDAAVSVAKWLVTSLTKAVALSLDVAGTVGGAIVDQFPDMWAAITSVATWLSDTVTRAISLTLDVGSAVVNVAATAISDFEKAIASALGVVKDAAGWTWRHSVGAVVDVVSGGGGDKGDSAAPAPVADPTAALQAAADLEAALARIQTASSGIVTALTSMSAGFVNAEISVQASANQMLTDISTLADSDFPAKATDAGNNFNTNLYTGMLAGQTTAQLVYSQMNADASTFGSDLSSKATTAGNDFNTSLYAGMLAGQNSAKGVFNQIGSDAGAFVANLRGLATAAGQAFNTSLYSGMRAGQDSAKGVFNQIASDAGSFVSNLRALATAAGNAFRDGLQSGFNSAVSAAQSAASSILGALSGLGSAGYSIGYDLGSGINSGISAWTSAIAATAAAAVSNAITAARNAAQAKSPSRKMIALGEDMGEGAVVGLLRMFRPLAGAAGDLAEAGVKGFSGRTFEPIRADLQASTSYTAAPLPVPAHRGGASGSSGGNTYVVMTRSELARFFDAVEVVEVLTTPEEIRAAMG